MPQKTKRKGGIKINNFKKIQKVQIYLPTNTKRYFFKNKINLKFYEEKMKEYDELKKELKE